MQSKVHVSRSNRAFLSPTRENGSGSRISAYLVVNIIKNVNNGGDPNLQDYHDLMLHVLIRDSERMRRRMFETDKLDLEKAVQMCQVMESTTVDLQQMGTRLEPQPGLTKPVEAQEGVAAVNSRRPSGSIGEKRRKDWPGAKPFSGSPHPCSRCGWSHKPRQCPAYGQKCLNCQGLNHFARMCNKANQQSAHLVGDWADPESPTAERGEVLLIAVERVGKKLLARVQFHIEG